MTIHSLYGQKTRQEICPPYSNKTSRLSVSEESNYPTMCIQILRHFVPLNDTSGEGKALG